MDILSNNNPNIEDNSASNIDKPNDAELTDFLEIICRVSYPDADDIKRY